MTSPTTTARLPVSADGYRGADPCSSAEAAFIGFFGELCHGLGIPRSYGQIYGLAFVSRRPVSFDDVVAVLGLSKGSASQGIRWLREQGVLRPEENRRRLPAVGDRREYFSPVLDVARLMSVILRERMQKPLASGGFHLAQIRALINSLPLSTGVRLHARARHLQQRMRRLEAWHRTTLRLAPALLRKAR